MECQRKQVVRRNALQLWQSKWPLLLRGGGRLDALHPTITSSPPGLVSKGGLTEGSAGLVCDPGGVT